MKTATEIRNALENIKYYAERLYTLAREQFMADAGLEDMNAEAGCIRFDALEAIGEGSNWIKVYCEGIEKNLETAVKQNKLLHSKEEEQE